MLSHIESVDISSTDNIDHNILSRPSMSLFGNTMNKNSPTVYSFPNFKIDESTKATLSHTGCSLATADVVSVSSTETPSVSTTLNLDACSRKRSRSDVECHEEDLILNGILDEAYEGAPTSPRPHSIMKHDGDLLEFPSPCVLDKNPEVFVQKLFESFLGFALTVRPTLELTSPSVIRSNCPFFPALTENDCNGYDMDIVTAIRDENLSALKALYSAGRSMSCSNRFGESLLHMACRRGFTSIVKFLVEEAGVGIRITDDCGRTPLHDTLWNRDCKFEIFDVLVGRDPALLLVSDKRGHTPFAYARKEHWESWITHLHDRKDRFKTSLDFDVMKLFCKEPSL